MLRYPHRIRLTHFEPIRRVKTDRISRTVHCHVLSRLGESSIPSILTISISLSDPADRCLVDIPTQLPLLHVHRSTRSAVLHSSSLYDLGPIRPHPRLMSPLHHPDLCAWGDQRISGSSSTMGRPSGLQRRVHSMGTGFRKVVRTDEDVV